MEMVTPKLTYAELPKLQECVRQVRHAGAKVNGSCGIHVHVDAANHNRQSLKNLIGIMYSKEILLFKALQVSDARASALVSKGAGTHVAASPDAFRRGDQRPYPTGEDLVRRAM